MDISALKTPYYGNAPYDHERNYFRFQAVFVTAINEDEPINYIDDDQYN